MYDVIALGEVLIDFTPSGVNDQGCLLFARNPGGAPANVLAANSRLGGKTALIGKVGDDLFGRFLAQTLAEAGIHTQGLVLDGKVHTTLAFVQIRAGGERDFGFYRDPGADTCLRPEEVDRSLVEQGDIFHFGSLSLTHEPARTATHFALEHARKRGKLISYDPNYRPPLWPDERTAVKAMASCLPYADLVKVSEEEMVLLTGETDLEQGSLRLAEQGPGLVLVSRGAAGCYYRRGTDCGQAPAFRVTAVDTTGAGDAFLGAVHAGLRGKRRADLQHLPVEQLEDILRFANAAGALTTTKPGAIPALPTREEIERLLRA